MATATSGAGSSYDSETVDLDDYSVREPVERAFYYQYGLAHPFGDGNVPGLSGDEDSIIHIKTELATKPGHTVGFGLIRNLGGAGKKNAEQLEDQEKTIESADCRVALGQHRDGVKSGDRLTRQGLTWRFLETSLKLLSRHVRTVDEIWFCTQAANYDATTTLSTYYDQGGETIDPTDTVWTGLNPTTVCDSDHLVHCSASQTNEANYTASDYLDRKYILEAVFRNELLMSGMTPVNIGGKDRFLLVVNTNVMRRIKESDTEWYALIKANLEGPKADIAWKAFTSRLNGEFEDVLILSSPFVPPGITGGTNGAPVSHVFRNFMVGAQAIAKCYGMATPNENKLGLVYGDRDHKNREYVSYFRVCGMQLTQFEDRGGTKRNHSSMVLPSYATRPTLTES